nr:hypothetical protein [Tanacetum cinerariifolium]
MAHQQLVANVHPDELCPPNKQYDLMDANKKIDLEHVQCLTESKILTNIIKNHLLRFSIAASSSVPWIYMAQFWHTLKEDSSKYMLKFILDKKILSLTLDDFTTIFHLPQATDNNHDRKYKYKVGMKIPDWMITEAMKQTERYRMLQRTPSAPRSPTPKVDVAESSVPTRSTVIRLYLPQQKSTCLTPPAPVLMVDKADELILQDTLQVSLAEHKSRQEKEARENVVLVEKHLAYEEIEKMVEGQEHVVYDSSIPKNDEHNIPGTRLEPKSDKESSKVKFTDVVILVNVYDEEEEKDKITDEVYDLKRREKGKNVEESKIIPSPTPIRSPRIHTDHELQGRYGYLFEHLRAKFMPRNSFVTLAYHLHEAMADSLPTMVDKRQEHVVYDSSIPKNDEHNIPGTRLEPKSDKESSKVKFTDVVILVNVYDEEEEEDKITDEVYDLKRREKGKNVEESKIIPSPTPIRSPRIHTDHVSSDTE